MGTLSNLPVIRIPKVQKRIFLTVWIALELMTVIARMVLPAEYGRLLKVIKGMLFVLCTLIILVIIPYKRHNWLSLTLVFSGLALKFSVELFGNL